MERVRKGRSAQYRGRVALWLESRLEQRIWGLWTDYRAASILTRVAQARPALLGRHLVLRCEADRPQTSRNRRRRL